MTVLCVGFIATVYCVCIVVALFWSSSARWFSVIAHWLSSFTIGWLLFFRGFWFLMSLTLVWLGSFFQNFFWFFMGFYRFLYWLGALVFRFGLS